MGVGGQHHAPAALPSEKTRYPLYSRLGGPQGRSGRVRKISPPPGFDPRTVQPVASRYTDWAMKAKEDNWQLYTLFHVGIKNRRVLNFKLRPIYPGIEFTIPVGMRGLRAPVQSDPGAHTAFCKKCAHLPSGVEAKES